VNKFPVRLLKFLALAIFLIGTLPAHAQESVVQLPDIFVRSDNYLIHVSHKAGPNPPKFPYCWYTEAGEMPRLGIFRAGV
jgi:hypothetical protein